MLGSLILVGAGVDADADADDTDEVIVSVGALNNREADDLFGVKSVEAEADADLL